MTAGRDGKTTACTNLACIVDAAPAPRPPPCRRRGWGQQTGVARRSSRCIRRNVTRKKTISCPTRRRVVATNRQENKLWQTRKNKKEKKKRNEPPGYFQRCLYYRGRSGALLSEGTRAPRSNDEGEKKLAPPLPPLGRQGEYAPKKNGDCGPQSQDRIYGSSPRRCSGTRGRCLLLLSDLQNAGSCCWIAAPGVHYIHTYIRTYVRTYVRTRAQRVIFTAYTAARPRL